MSNHESNAELMFRLAAIDQAASDAAAREKAVRDELVVANLGVVQPCATWFRLNWKGRDPKPTVDELVSIGYMALVRAAVKIPSTAAKPAAYFRTAIKHAMARESFAEHATSGLPDETALRQLEVGEADGKKGIDWSKGYDGVLVPIPAGTPRSQRLSAGKTRNWPGRQFNSRRDAEEAARETTAALLHVCGTDTQRRVVTILAEGHTRCETADVFGVARSTVQRTVETIRKRYVEYLAEIEKNGPPRGTKPGKNALVILDTAPGDDHEYAPRSKHR